MQKQEIIVPMILANSLMVIDLTFRASRKSYKFFFSHLGGKDTVMVTESITCPRILICWEGNTDDFATLEMNPQGTKRV